MRVVKFGEHFRHWKEEDIGKEVILQYGFGTRVEAKIVAVPYMVTINHIKDGADYRSNNWLATVSLSSVQTVR